MEVYAHDPGPVPDEALGLGVRVVEDEADFYALNADLFHLALHPTHRQGALGALFARARQGDDLLVLNEKPMAAPENPAHCRTMLARVHEERLALLYDFLELFEPMTARIERFLAGFQEVRLTEIRMQRSKDREDPANPRNRKIMVPIQYQETVHCLAFVLHLLGRLRGGLEDVLLDGLVVSGASEPYNPPNPEEYPYVVDGRFEGDLRFGDVPVHLTTDFKRGAEWTKRRSIRGIGDGEPFCIEAEYLEGSKSLRFNGRDAGVAPDANSYEKAVEGLWEWRCSVPREVLLSGVYPNPGFAYATYLISSMLWDACSTGQAVWVGSKEELDAYAPGFPARAKNLPRYS